MKYFSIPRFCGKYIKGTDAVSVPFFHLVPFLRYISAVGVRYIRREFTHGVFAEVIAGRAQSS